mgnify:CR=1 FL=1
MPSYLTRTELKKQRLEETRAKYPTIFETAYEKLYGRDDVAKAISITPAPAGKESLVDNQQCQIIDDHECKECGQDHSFKQNFEDVKTSIDIIPEMLRRRQPLKETRRHE